jgi:hypothetical protein
MLRSAGDAGPRPLLIWNFKSSSFTPPLQPAFGPAERTPHPAAQRRKESVIPVHTRPLDRSEAESCLSPSSRLERSVVLSIPVISTGAKRSGETPAFRSSTSPSSRPKRSGHLCIPVISTGAKRSGETPAFFFVAAFAPPNPKQRKRQTESKNPIAARLFELQDTTHPRYRPRYPRRALCKFNPCSPSAASTHAN